MLQYSVVLLQYGTVQYTYSMNVYSAIQSTDTKVLNDDGSLLCASWQFSH